MSWHQNRSWGKTSLQPSLVPWSAKVSCMQVNSRDSRHNLVSPNSAVEVCYWIVQRFRKRNRKESSFPLPSLAGTKTLCTIRQTETIVGRTIDQQSSDWEETEKEKRKPASHSADRTYTKGCWSARGPPSWEESHRALLYACCPVVITEIISFIR